MNKKITLTLVVDMNEETFNYYIKETADLHEALIISNNAKISIEDTTEESQEHWGE